MNDFDDEDLDDMIDEFQQEEKDLNTIDEYQQKLTDKNYKFRGLPNNPLFGRSITVSHLNFTIDMVKRHQKYLPEKVFSPALKELFERLNIK